MRLTDSQIERGTERIERKFVTSLVALNSLRTKSAARRLLSRSQIFSNN